MKKYLALFVVMMLTLTVAGCGQKKETNEEANTETNAAQGEVFDTIIQSQLPKEGEEIAVLKTSKGDIKMRFFPEEAPKAVENFKTLAKDGYYDGLTFHRVIEDFMVQTGDPTGTGAGGESCWGESFEDEVSPKLHYYNGAVAMANSGPNTNGSQFFIVQQKSVSEQHLKQLEETKSNNEEKIGITIGDTFYTIEQLFPDSVIAHYRQEGGAVHLEYVFGNAYTVFGQVLEGMDVVDAIAASDVDGNDKPKEDIIIESITWEPYQVQ